MHFLFLFFGALKSPGQETRAGLPRVLYATCVVGRSRRFEPFLWLSFRRSCAILSRCEDMPVNGRRLLAMREGEEPRGGREGERE